MLILRRHTIASQAGPGISYPAPLLPPLFEDGHFDGRLVTLPTGHRVADTTGAGYRGFDAPEPNPAEMITVATLNPSSTNQQWLDAIAASAANPNVSNKIVLENGLYNFTASRLIQRVGSFNPSGTFVVAQNTGQAVITSTTPLTDNQGYFQFEAATSLVTSVYQVARDSLRGFNRIYLSSTTGLNVGDYVKGFFQEPPDFWKTRFQTRDLGNPSTGTSWYRDAHQIRAIGTDPEFGPYIVTDSPLVETFRANVSTNVSRIQKYLPLLNVGVIGVKFEFPTNPGGSGRCMGFERCWDVFVKDVEMDRPPTSAFEFDSTRRITVRRATYLNPWNKSGGGNGYFGPIHVFDADFDQCTSIGARHAPNVQELSYRCVIRKSTFQESDAHIGHARYPRHITLEENTIEKGAWTMPWAWLGAAVFNPDDNSLQPTGGVVTWWNNQLDNGTAVGRGGRAGGLEEDHNFLYNLVHIRFNGVTTVNQLPAFITFFPYQYGDFGYIVDGNTFWSEDADIKNTVAFGFTGGLIQGQGMSGRNIDLLQSPPYDASAYNAGFNVPPTDPERKVYIFRNTIIGNFGENRFQYSAYAADPYALQGQGGPINNIRQDNTWRPYPSPITPPNPPFASVHEYIKELRRAFPQYWTPFYPS